MPLNRKKTTEKLSPSTESIFILRGEICGTELLNVLRESKPVLSR